MRVVFIGSQEYGHQGLEALLSLPISIVGVVTLRPAAHEVWGEGPTVAGLAERHHIPTRIFDDHLTHDEATATINAPETQAFIRALEPDLLVVYGWRQIIGRAIRRIPPLGTIGIHFSLLPQLRGHSPVPWTILTGASEAGLSLFYLEDGADTGDVIAQKRTPVTLDDTAGTVRARLADLAIEVLREAVPLLAEGRAPRHPQDHAAATIAGYRLPDAGRIDWTQPTRQIHDVIRATTRPYPGAFTFDRDRLIRVWASRLLPDRPRYVGQPGQILLVAPGEGVIVKTGDHALMLTEGNPEGEPPGLLSTFLRDTRRRLGYDPEATIHALRAKLAAHTGPPS